ncbi:conjugal transfer protein TraN [Acidithiobacillus ferriphilus]|uniref:conjugal transfer protein TraN n=1 Tax=Acidithiobacillus ferriphilus TaxID=1689834 RepID=UPI001C062BD5|nr:conjugal transfer protein TraN [Acidithiobacillus ferriphilus]MBU2785237.1 conjugal transfer protein TraN [Acidithiobacillus ferriphilus]
MSFFIWLGHPRRKRNASLLFAMWTAAIGVYYEATATAEAGTFINQAQGGVNFGGALLGGGQADAASGAGTQEMQGFAGMSPAGSETGVSQYYLQDNVGLTPGNALNQASSANAALMSNPNCPSNWPQPLDAFTQNAMGSLQAMSRQCRGVITSINQSISSGLAQNAGAAAAPFQQVQQAENTFSQAEGGVQTAGMSLTNDCAPSMGGGTQYAPACNLLSQSGVPSVAGLATTWQQTFGQVQSQCAALPTQISAANAGYVSQAFYNMAGALNNLDGNAGGAVGVSGNGNGAVALSSGYAAGATTPDAQAYQQILGMCSYAQSYLENISTYPGGMNAYAGDPMVNNFMNNPANQPMINAMMPFIESNPSVFQQYFQNTACTNNNTNIANAGQNATGPSTTTTNSPSIQSSPVSCTEPLSNYTSSGWINGADWPDPNAEWIYGTSGGCGGGVPNGQTDLMEGTYSNATGAVINATLYIAADDECSVDINGQQVATYSDGGTGGDGAQAYPSTGGVVSVPVTLQPGPNEIMDYITNSDTASNAPNPSAGILSIIGTVNGQNQVLIDTSGSWAYVPQNQTQAGTSSVTVNAGQVTTSTTPNTHAQSMLCTGAPLKCLGTQCHALFGNQDLHFSQAMTAMSALQQMEQNMQCAAGTSIAAGDCQPIIFQGTENYCRTWPFGGSFTNNCCQQGLQAGASGENLSQYLMIARNTWSLANNSVVDSNIWAFGQFHGWVESAYSSMDQWASTAWRYATSVFKGAAQDVANAFGFSGSAASSAVGVSSTAVKTGTQVASKGLISGMETEIENWLKNEAKKILTQLLGRAMSGEIMGAVSAVAGIVAEVMSVVGIIYLIYQIAQIIAQLLTACTNEEFKLGESRKLHACQNIGTYCAQKFMGFCLMHKDIFCCYGSPLARIIASQIRIGQPNVAGGYGTPQAPDCNGFTPQQLGQVDWSQISLSAWQAMLQQAGLVAGGNAQGSAIYQPQYITHPSGNSLYNGAPQPITQ